MAAKIKSPTSWATPNERATLVREIERAVDESRKLNLYTVATLPDPVANRGMQIIVTDEAGGEVPAWSDGTDWRRLTDRAVVS